MTGGGNFKSCFAVMKGLVETKKKRKIRIFQFILGKKEYEKSPKIGKESSP